MAKLSFGWRKTTVEWTNLRWWYADYYSVLPLLAQFLQWNCWYYCNVTILFWRSSLRVLYLSLFCQVSFFRGNEVVCCVLLEWLLIGYTCRWLTILSPLSSGYKQVKPLRSFQFLTDYPLYTTHPYPCLTHFSLKMETTKRYETLVTTYRCHSQEENISKCFVLLLFCFTFFKISYVRCVISGT
jgi:hypothetical protein